MYLLIEVFLRCRRSLQRLNNFFMRSEQEEKEKIPVKSNLVFRAFANHYSEELFKLISIQTQSVVVTIAFCLR